MVKGGYVLNEGVGLLGFDLGLELISQKKSLYYCPFQQQSMERRLRPH